MKILKNKAKILITLLMVAMTCITFALAFISPKPTYADIDYTNQDYKTIPSGFKYASEDVVYKIHCPDIRTQYSISDIEDYVTKVVFYQDEGGSIYFIEGVAYDYSTMQQEGEDFETSNFSDYYEILQYDDVNKYLYFKYKNLSQDDEFIATYSPGFCIYNRNSTYINEPQYINISDLKEESTNTGWEDTETGQYDYYYGDKFHFSNEYTFHKDTESELFMYEFKLMLNKSLWPKNTDYISFGFSSTNSPLTDSDTYIAVPNSTPMSGSYYGIHPDLNQTVWTADDTWRYLTVNVFIDRIDTDIQITAQVNRISNGNMSAVSSVVSSPVVDWYTDFCGSIDEVIIENERLHGVIEEKEAEIAELQATIEDLRQSITETNEELARVQAELDALKIKYANDTTKMQEEYDELLAQKNRIESDYEALKIKYKNATENLDKEHSEFIDIINNYSSQVSQLKKENSELKKHNAEIQSELDAKASSGCSTRIETANTLFIVLCICIVVVGGRLYAGKKK